MASAVVDAKSAITHVTVYEDKAQVQRSSRVSLEKGVTCVTYKDLPSSFSTDSFQVALHVDGEATVILKGVAFDTVFVEDSSSLSEDECTKKRKELVESAERIENELCLLREEMDLDKTRAEMIESLFTASVEDTTHAPVGLFDTKTWSDIIQKNVSEQESLIKTRRTKQRIVAEKMQIVRDLRSQIDTICPRKNKVNVVKVSLEANVAVMKVDVQLSYLVDRASWRATYDVRINRETQEVDMTYNAIVTQSTEEEWKDVEVSLSTARPSISGKQPELKPWRITSHLGGSVSASRGGSMAKKKRGMALREQTAVVADGDNESDEDNREYEPAQVISAEVNTTSATSVSFTVPRTHTLHRNGEPIRLTLARFPLKASFHYISVPKESDGAFAQATTVNTSQYVLLAGVREYFHEQRVRRHLHHSTGVPNGELQGQCWH